MDGWPARYEPLDRYGHIHYRSIGTGKLTLCRLRLRCCTIRSVLQGRWQHVYAGTNYYQWPFESHSRLRLNNELSVRQEKLNKSNDRSVCTQCIMRTCQVSAVLPGLFAKMGLFHTVKIEFLILVS